MISDGGRRRQGASPTARADCPSGRAADRAGAERGARRRPIPEARRRPRRVRGHQGRRRRGTVGSGGSTHSGTRRADGRRGPNGLRQGPAPRCRRSDRTPASPRSEAYGSYERRSGQRSAGTSFIGMPMLPSKPCETHPGLRSQGPVKVPTKIVGGDLIHQVFDGFGDTLAANLVVLQAAAHCDWNGDRGGSVFGGLHRPTIESIGLVGDDRPLVGNPPKPLALRFGRSASAKGKNRALGRHRREVRISAIPAGPISLDLRETSARAGPRGHPWGGGPRTTRLRSSGTRSPARSLVATFVTYSQSI